MKKLMIMLLFLLSPGLLLAEVPGVVLLLPQGPVSGTVLIEAAASDAGCGVRNVQLFLDGAALGPSLTTAPYTYSWDSTDVPDGDHEIRALAYDRSGGPSAAQGQECNEMVPNISTPAIRMVAVDNIPLDTTPPTVTITSPMAGSTVSGGVAIDIAASDPSGVGHVHLYINNELRNVATHTARIVHLWDSNLHKGQSVSLRTEVWDLPGNGPSFDAIEVQVAK